MESYFVTSQVQRYGAAEFPTALSVQRDGAALRDSKRPVAQENADSRRRLSPASGCDPLGTGRARRRRAGSEASGIRPQPPHRNGGGGNVERSAFLGTVLRRSGRAGASRIPLQGADRSQAKVRRKSFREL